MGAHVVQSQTRGLILLRGVRTFEQADLPEQVDGHKTPSLARLRWMLREGKDRALDGCPLEDQGTLCSHGEASWLATLDLL